MAQMLAEGFEEVAPSYERHSSKRGKSSSPQSMSEDGRCPKLGCKRVPTSSEMVFREPLCRAVGLVRRALVCVEKLEQT